MGLRTRLAHLREWVGRRVRGIGTQTDEPDVDPGDRRRFLQQAGVTLTAAGIGVSASSGGTHASNHDPDEETCDNLGRTDLSELPWNSRGLSGRSLEANKGYGGWVASEHFNNLSTSANAPPRNSLTGPIIIYVHGNSGDACHFEEHAEYMLNNGWKGHDLWAISFAEGVSDHDEMADQLEDFVRDVREFLGPGGLIEREYAFVSHSLGVTGTRYWAQKHYLSNGNEPPFDYFVGMNGANNGLKWCSACQSVFVDGCTDFTKSNTSSCAWAKNLPDDFPNIKPSEVCQTIADDCVGDGGILDQLNNTGGQTPADACYFTIRSEDDILFSPNPYLYPAFVSSDSPTLNGARENHEYGTFDDMGHMDSLKKDACGSNCEDPPEKVKKWLTNNNCGKTEEVNIPRPPLRLDCGKYPVLCGTIWPLQLPNEAGNRWLSALLYGPSGSVVDQVELDPEALEEDEAVPALTLNREEPAAPIGEWGLQIRDIETGEAVYETEFEVTEAEPVLSDARFEYEREDELVAVEGWAFDLRNASGRPLAVTALEVNIEGQTEGLELESPAAVKTGGESATVVNPDSEILLEDGPGEYGAEIGLVVNDEFWRSFETTVTVGTPEGDETL